MERSLRLGDPYGLLNTLAWSEMDALDLASELIELLDPNREICEGLLLAMDPMEPNRETCDGLLLLNPKLLESISFGPLLPCILLEPFKTSESSGGDMDELLRLDSLVGEPENKLSLN